MSDPPKLNLVPITAPSQPTAPPQAPATPTAAPSSTSPRKRASEQPPEPRPRSAPSSTPRGAAAAWREWSAFDRTVSYRLPPELLAELDQRIWKLRLPIGVTVAAAIADLLDKQDTDVLKLVERAEECKPRRRPRSTS